MSSKYFERVNALSVLIESSSLLLSVSTSSPLPPPIYTAKIVSVSVSVSTANVVFHTILNIDFVYMLSNKR